MTTQFVTRILIASIVVTVNGATTRADDWPQFLGPERNGMVRETGLNWNWKANPPKVLWKVPLGSAMSSMTIVGDRLFTMAKNGPRDGVVCLDVKTGEVLWRYDAAPTYIDRQKQGAGPRSTPTYHSGKLYCLFGMGELLCIDADGKKLWQADMFKDTGATNPGAAVPAEWFYWGVSMSPIVEGDLVIVQPGGDNNSSIAAYHKDTGKLVWMIGSDPPGYASPIAIEVIGKRLIVVPTGQSIIGLNARKPEILWRYPFGNKFNATGATPVWANNLLFVSAAYRGGSALLDIVLPTAGSSMWTVREVWKTEKNMQNLMATSIILDGHIYGCHGDLNVWFMRCLEQKTGAIKWEERVTNRQSLLAAEGHLLSMGERGTLTLLEARPDRYNVKAELPDLLAYKTWAMPAFSNGKLFLRDERHVLCLDLSKR